MVQFSQHWRRLTKSFKVRLKVNFSLQSANFSQEFVLINLGIALLLCGLNIFLLLFLLPLIKIILWKKCKIESQSIRQSQHSKFNISLLSKCPPSPNSPSSLKSPRSPMMKQEIRRLVVRSEAKLSGRLSILVVKFAAWVSGCVCVCTPVYTCWMSTLCTYMVNTYILTLGLYIYVRTHQAGLIRLITVSWKLPSWLRGAKQRSVQKYSVDLYIERH